MRDLRGTPSFEDWRRGRPPDRYHGGYVERHRDKFLGLVTTRSWLSESYATHDLAFEGGVLVYHSHEQALPRGLKLEVGRTLRQRWRQKVDPFQAVSPGMTLAEVLAILGRPLWVRESGDCSA